jgi:exodeoxyribonuclease (lambda-induced)
MPIFNTQGVVVNSPQWVRARIGHLTASRMSDVLDFRKDGKPGAARLAYLKDLVAERLCDSAMDHYVSEPMQWGLDHEDEAKHIYSNITGQHIGTAEFILHRKIEFFGATPDGLIGDDGLVEIKCPTTRTFIDWRLADEVPAAHQPQMLAQIACTGRKWCDFMAYDPRIKFGSQYFVLRFEPTPEQIHEVEVAAIQFLREVDAMFERMTRTDTRPSP